MSEREGEREGEGRREGEREREEGGREGGRKGRGEGEKKEKREGGGGGEVEGSKTNTERMRDKRQLYATHMSLILHINLYAEFKHNNNTHSQPAPVSDMHTHTYLP